MSDHHTASHHDAHGYAGDHLHHHAHSAADGGTLVIDPVCGMQVDSATSQHHAEWEGHTFHFCSAGCRTRFVTAPGRYLNKASAGTKPAPRGTIYTCPMHPEIRQDKPGNCPICGMALEPAGVAEESGPNPEYLDMRRRFWIGLTFALPVFILEMAGHLPLFGRLHFLSPAVSNWVQFALATPVVLWAGWPFFTRGWASLISRHLNMFTLIALGTGVAYMYSVVATLVPGAFPPGFRSPDGTVAVYFEAAAVITVLGTAGPGAGTSRTRADGRGNSRPAEPRTRRPPGG